VSFSDSVSPKAFSKTVTDRKTAKMLPHFRRSLQFVWPQRRYLYLSVLSVIGISVFYTVSLSSVAPFLKIMFNQYETTSDWVYRNDSERRLRCTVAVDVARDTPTGKSLLPGVHIKEVEPWGPLGTSVVGGDRIISINGQGGDHYEMLRLMSQVPPGSKVDLVVQHIGRSESTTVRDILPRKSKWYTPYLIRVANLLPATNDPSSKVTALALVMGLLVFVEILGGFCRFFQEYLEGVISNRAMIDIRTRGYRNMLRLPMSWFSQQQAGDTLSRFARDSTILELGIATLFGKTMREPFKAMGVLGLAAMVSPYMLIVIGIIAPIAAILIRKLGKKLRRAQNRAMVAWGAMVDMLEEKIAGIRIVKGYNMERHEALTFFRQHRRMMRQQLKIAMIDAAVSPLLEVMGMVAVGGIAVAGGFLVFHGRLDAEMFFALVVCVAGMFDPIRKLANVNNRLQAADAAAQRLFEVIDMVPEEDCDGRAVIARLPEIHDGIEFRNVTFAYPNNPDKPVLVDINLKVKAGEIVAIVGPNGSGKTTLCSLLMRFYKPDQGQILLDGVDINVASVGSLRSQIGLVTQDTVIFSDTARANIAYGEKDATNDEILQAARTAYADEFIQEIRTERGDEVLTGYEAPINSRSLSGGQKQRIAIARAVLRDPAILIFDEATSQIDSDSEMKIQRALNKIMHGRTTFVIAHRFSTINQAQRIVVMDVGRIVAVGTHETLITSCPLYRTLYETQFREAV